MEPFKLPQFVLIALLLLFIGNIAEGQVVPVKKIKPVFITGITFDSKTHEPLSNTNFKINNKINFSTNESGRFSFYGNPGDSIVFTYLGYHPNRLIVPDSLKSDEYVMGVFMNEESVELAEIIILRRIASSSMIITPVQSDQQAKDIAQSNVDKAVVEGLTKSPKVYDADMNAKKTMRTNQMRVEYKGMLVTPENSVGISTQNFKTNNIIYGSPIFTSNKVAKEMVTDSESAILIGHFEALKRGVVPLETVPDTTGKR